MTKPCYWYFLCYLNYDKFGIDKYSQKSLKRIYLREKHAITIIQKQPPEVFYELDVKSFTKLTRKHLCRILHFKEIAGLRCFPLSFVRFLKTP